MESNPGLCLAAGRPRSNPLACSPTAPRLPAHCRPTCPGPPCGVTATRHCPACRCARRTARCSWCPLPAAPPLPPWCNPTSRPANRSCTRSTRQARRPRQRFVSRFLALLLLLLARARAPPPLLPTGLSMPGWHAWPLIGAPAPGFASCCRRLPSHPHPPHPTHPHPPQPTQPAIHLPCRCSSPPAPSPAASPQLPAPARWQLPRHTPPLEPTPLAPPRPAPQPPQAAPPAWRPCPPPHTLPRGAGSEQGPVCGGCQGAAVRASARWLRPRLVQAGPAVCLYVPLPMMPAARFHSQMHCPIQQPPNTCMIHSTRSSMHSWMQLIDHKQLLL